MQVVIILVPPVKIALRTSATTSDRYGGRIKHTNKDSYGYVGQIAAVEGVAPFLISAKSMIFSACQPTGTSLLRRSFHTITPPLDLYG